MAKITIVVLALTALIYAAYLVLTNRQVPKPKNFSGGRRRFILATLLFVGLMGKTSVIGRESSFICYGVPSPQSNKISRQELVVVLKAIWQTLDPKRLEEFWNKLETAAKQGVIRRKTANMLAITFKGLSYHKQRTRGKGPRVTCYEMTQLGYTLYTTRENALKQLELLAKARQSGTIDTETAAKAHTVLAREAEMLHDSQSYIHSSNWYAQDLLIQQYKSGEIVAGDAASVTAGMIIEMEGGQVPGFTAAKRLATMKERVEKLIKDGPIGNDWIDPAIQPNVSAILEKAGLIKNRIRVLCYDRAAVPVQARSDELKKLQQQLLDKNVKPGVLDVEVAEKAEQIIDYATEKDIRDYQKKLRQVARLLYKNGELPSSFVNEFEKAADIDIIAFNPGKALRNDMSYHLRSLFWLPVGNEVLKTLEKRKLIPPARNHRRIMSYFGRKPQLSEEQKKQLADFQAMIDGDATFELPGDEKVKIKKWQIPRDDIEYRLKMRTVCRALVKTGLVKNNQLKQLEKLIAIPIIGTLEAK
jgi:hypothetical protein